MRKDRRPSKSQRRITDDFGIQVTVKQCNKCDLWLDPEDDYYEGRYGTCKKCKSAQFKRYREENLPIILEKNRQNYYRVKEDPELYAYYLAAQRKRRRPRKPEQKLRYSRQYYANIKADPERHKAYLAKMRMAARLRREKAGMSSYPARGKSKLKYPENDTRTLPADPLASWVERKLANGYAGSTFDLAKACKVDDRRIRTIRDKQYPRLDFDSVDAILINEGTTRLEDIYTEDQLAGKE